MQTICRKKIFRLILPALMCVCPIVVMGMGSIRGIIVDKKTGEAVIGAAVIIENSTVGAATDVNGGFRIEGVKAGHYNLKVSCISYRPLIVERVNVVDGKDTGLRIEMEGETIEIGEVTVKAVRRINSEVAVISAVKAAPVVMNAVSGQMIARTQDRDAGEVVKRLPGVSIMGDRFIVLRGLSQRYNNVWINNMPAPSSEADQRAFSFDVLPGNVIDNMMILKTTSPEYPSDYAGGFVHIRTKGTASDNSMAISVGTGFETGSTFRTFLKNPAGPMAWSGFNGKQFSLPASAKADFTGLDPDRDYPRLEKIARDFNADWEPSRGKALPDLRLSFFLTRNMVDREELGITNISSLSFSNSSSIHEKNVSLWGMYDERYHTPLPLSINEQTIYDQSAKLSLLHNWIFRMGRDHQIEFRNFFNNVSSNRVVDRYQDKNPNKFKGTELSFVRRMTYTGQLSGNHYMASPDKKLDWTIGYCYADKSEPDQKQYDFYMDNNGEYYLPVMTTPNINRISNKLGEHIGSGALNFSKKIMDWSLEPELKAGVYAEYKTRDFKNRWFIYLPVYPGSLEFYDQSPDGLLGGDYFKDEQGGIRIQELTERSDSYDANSFLAAGYVSAVLPLAEWLSLSGGVRVENNVQRLNSFQQSTGSENIPLHVKNNHLNFFPSAQATFSLNLQHQIRLAYSSSINRPEFREIAPYVFYDFENDVTIHGNMNLEDCKIKGYDLRYEWYPTVGETVSVAFFYKDFRDMIELVQMGSLYPITYKYENVPSGKSYGAEIDIRKNLARTGVLKNFSLLLNASWIKSKVEYKTGYESRSREMQGQSPYIVNAGLFYQNDKLGLSVNGLYNVIGKRIIVNGDYSSVTSDRPDNYIPDTYEIPRNVLDINVTQRIGKFVDIKLSAKDLINNPEEMRQTYENGYVARREKVNSGRKFFVSLGVKF